MNSRQRRESKPRLWLRKGKARLNLENLEDRTLLSVTVIEDFSSGTLDAYRTIYRYEPSAQIVPGAGHDGVSNALLKQDGYEWMLREDDGTAIHQGETVAAWTQFSGTVDGRSYLAFGAHPYGLVHSPFTQGHTLALVLAGNTNQLMFEANDTGAGFQPAPHVIGTPVSQTYDPDTWYQMEVVWGVGGSLTGNLYDYNGNLLNSVTATETAITSGGIGFRGFGSDKYFDTVTVDDGTGPGGIPHGGAVHGARAVHIAPANPVNVHQQPLTTAPNGQRAGDDGTGTPVPWDYTSVPGSGRDIELASWNGIQQFGRLGDVVALAGSNVSHNVGDYQVSWGPSFYSGGSGTVAPETPLLAQYVFRQLPGEATTLIGSSDVKHFFSTVSSDFQNLNPGESDPYGSGLNASQQYMLPGSDLNPVTGEMHRPSGFSNVDANGDGFDIHFTGSFDAIQHRLQVNIEDLDPAQNPAGTRWFFMGNLWVAGDDNVDNNSRWVEITPSWNGTTFTFSYPQGSGGQLNFRTIPGLVSDTLSVISQSPSGNVGGPVDHVRLTFSAAVNPDTFGVGQVHSFNGPSGPITVNSVTPVDKSDLVFDVAFDPQTDFGAYTMVVGPDIYDMSGNPMPAPYTASFNIIDVGTLVNGDFETGNFNGWTLSGDTSYMNVTTSNPHTGSYAAELGPVGSLSYLYQTIATTPGQTYRLTYWLYHQGGTPNEFQVSIGGTVVFDQSNMGSFAYTQYSFDYVATGSSATIQFGAREDPSFFYLDDVAFQSLGGSPGRSGGGFQTRPITDGSLATALAPLTIHPGQGLVGMEVPLASSPVNDPRQVPLDQYFASGGAKGNPGLALPRTVNTVPGLDPIDPFAYLQDGLVI